MLQEQALQQPQNGPKAASPFCKQVDSATSSLEDKQAALEDLRRKVEARTQRPARRTLSQGASGIVVRIADLAGQRRNFQCAMEARPTSDNSKLWRTPAVLEACRGDMAVRRGKGFCELSMVPMALVVPSHAKYRAAGQRQVQMDVQPPCFEAMLPQLCSLIVWTKPHA